MNIWRRYGQEFVFYDSRRTSRCTLWFCTMINAQLKSQSFSQTNFIRRSSQKDGTSAIIFSVCITVHCIEQTMRFSRRSRWYRKKHNASHEQSHGLAAYVVVNVRDTGDAADDDDDETQERGLAVVTNGPDLITSHDDVAKYKTRYPELTALVYSV